MLRPNRGVKDAPIITIFVRHSLGCPHTGDELYKRCSCWKHLCWSYKGKQFREPCKEKTRAGAERVKREQESSYEMAGKPAEPESPPMVRQAIETFLRDKQGHGRPRFL